MVDRTKEFQQFVESNGGSNIYLVNGIDNRASNVQQTSFGNETKQLVILHCFVEISFKELHLTFYMFLGMCFFSKFASFPISAKCRR
jgi:hypothetical protein